MKNLKLFQLVSLAFMLVSCGNSIEDKMKDYFEKVGKAEYEFSCVTAASFSMKDAEQVSKLCEEHLGKTYEELSAQFNDSLYMKNLKNEFLILGEEYRATDPSELEMREFAKEIGIIEKAYKEENKEKIEKFKEALKELDGLDGKSLTGMFDDSDVEKLKEAQKDLKKLNEGSTTEPANINIEDESSDEEEVPLLLEMIIDRITGVWSGKFGDKTIELNLQASADSTISGTNTVGENSRPIIGSFTGNLQELSIELEEPGDEEWDGVFEIEVGTFGSFDYQLKGIWKSNNGKLEREFMLQKY